MLRCVERRMTERRNVTFQGRVGHLKLDQLCRLPPPGHQQPKKRFKRLSHASAGVTGCRAARHPPIASHQMNSYATLSAQWCYIVRREWRIPAHRLRPVCFKKLSLLSSLKLIFSLSLPLLLPSSLLIFGRTQVEPCSGTSSPPPGYGPRCARARRRQGVHSTRRGHAARMRAASHMCLPRAHRCTDAGAGLGRLQPKPAPAPAPLLLQRPPPLPQPPSPVSMPPPTPGWRRSIRKVIRTTTARWSLPTSSAPSQLRPGTYRRG